MLQIKSTKDFDKWLTRLKIRDTELVGRILVRIQRLQAGNPGDVKNLGDGVEELRLNFSSGYRIYFTRRESVVVFLLAGGDKSSQVRDIKKAKKYAKQLEHEDEN
jgi:putative addiction module killer protein